MAEIMPHYPHLSFERPSHEEDFREGMRTLGARSRTVFLKLLESCFGESSPYTGKVVLGVPPFAVHLYEPEFPKDVVAWFAPRRNYVLIRLFGGTYVGDVLNLVTNPNMLGTPHPMNLQIGELSEIPTALTYIHTAAQLRNPR